MKSLLFILLLICVAFTGCDGKNRVYLSNTEVLKKHKLLDSFSENIKYFPEKYSETKIDTLLANGFRVNIKTFTDMESSYLNKFKTSNTVNKHYYRENKAAVTITNKGVIFNKLLDKNFFLNFDMSLQVFLNEAILQGVWLNEEDSQTNSNITIDVHFCKPVTNLCKYFKLKIEKNGKYKIINDNTK